MIFPIRAVIVFFFNFEGTKILEQIQHQTVWTEITMANGIETYNFRKILIDVTYDCTKISRIDFMPFDRILI